MLWKLRRNRIYKKQKQKIQNKNIIFKGSEKWNQNNWDTLNDDTLVRWLRLEKSRWVFMFVLLEDTDVVRKLWGKL